jgi:protein O-mannosyl-transferase
MTAKQQWLRGAFPYALIVAATLIVWGHTTRFQFVWDDRQFIQELESIRSIQSVPAMFYRLDAQSSYPEGFKLFRPLRTVHYAVNFWLGGKPEPQPWIFHVTNLLWHAGAAMLLFSVSARLFRKLTDEVDPVDSPSSLMTPTRWWALWVALAFAVHPIVSEVVCWAKSLDDAMATVFTLASLRALLKWDGRPQTLAAALAWYALAIYSKISAVPFAMMAMAVFIFILHVPWRKALRLSSGFAVIAALFLVHRHFVIGQSTQTAPISGTYAQTLIDMFPVVPKYLRLLCGAPPFHIDYSYLTGGHAPFSLVVLFGAGTLLLALIVAARALRNRQTLLAGVGLLWIGLFLLPVSNLLPMMQYMAERFLYLPLIGFLWCSVTVLRCLPRARACAIATTATLAIWACVAWNRSWIWQDEVTLFVQSSQAGPKTQRVQENAVAAIFNLPHVKAMFTLDKATRVLRVNGTPAPEQQPAIEETLVQARSMFPEDDVLASALGIFYGSTQRPAQAVPLFRFAAERKPTNPLLWANLGQASVEAKDWKQAEDALNKALALAPRNVDALRSLSRMHWQRGQYQAAAEVLRKLQEIEPANTQYAQWIREAEQRAQ